MFGDKKKGAMINKI